MPLLQFFLGRHKSISWAELRAIGWGNKDKDPLSQQIADRLHHNYNDFFIKNTLLLSTHLDRKRLNKRFEIQAGSFKVAKVIKFFTQINQIDSVDFLINKLLDSINESTNTTKLFMVINFYGDFRTKDATPIRRYLKETLKSNGIKVKFLGAPNKLNYNSATTTKVLKKQGIELNLTFDKSQKLLVISKTVFVQDFDLWERVDAKRPFKDLKKGMLPSKLARIMLNLAKVSKNSGFWDPFVGLGTTVMQGQFLQAYSYGSDIDKDVLYKAEQNVVWLLKSGLVPELRYKLFYFDVKRSPKRNKMLKSIIKHGRFDAIVTEGYLGKPRFKPFSTKKQAILQWSYVKPLYKALFKVQLPALKEEGRIVVTLPMYKYKTGKGTHLWFIPNPPYSKIRYNLIKFNTGKLHWINKDSSVGRNIVVLERKVK